MLVKYFNNIVEFSTILWYYKYNLVESSTLFMRGDDRLKILVSIF